MCKSFNLLWAFALAGAFFASGCEEGKIELSDVQDAQSDVKEQAEETREVASEAQERIQEKQKELADVTAEERERVAAEKAKLDKEKTEAANITEKYRTQESQDEYETQQRARLDAAKARIDAFDRSGDTLEDAAADAHNAKVDRLNDLYNAADTQLDDLEAAEAEVWFVKHESFESAMKRLQAALAEDDPTPRTGAAVPADEAIP